MKSSFRSISIKILNNKEIALRMYSFFVIKFGLVFTRWSLILISYYKLNTLDFALLASSFSLIEILRIIAEFGTEGFIYSRLIRKKTTSKIIYALIELRLLIALLLSAACMGIASYGYDINKGLIFILLPLFSIENSSFAFLQKRNDIKNLLKISIASLITLLLIYIYIRKNEVNLNLMVGFFIIPDLIISGLCLFFTKENWLLCSINIATILKKNKKIMDYVIPSGLVGIIVICYSRLDLILVLPLLGQAQQAIYSYAFRFVEPFTILTSLFTLSFITEIGGTNNQKLKNKYNQILVATENFQNKALFFISSLIISEGLILASEFLMGFHHKVLIFILSMTIILKFINNLLISFFFRTSQYLDLLKIVTLNFLIILSSGIVLGELFGLNGIACATITGEVYLYSKLKKYISKKLTGQLIGNN